MAHNESKYIKRCLDSILAGSQLPDEIVVVAHNCTDDTAAIAEEVLFNQDKVTNWLVDEYDGEKGVVYARIRGFELVKNEIVTCLDGDSYASHNFVRELVAQFRSPSVVAVGGFTILYGNIWTWLMSWDFFIWKRWYQPKRNFYFWGSNFAVRKSKYMEVGGLRPLIGLRTRLGLATWSEDLYLSRRLSEVGRVAFARNARIYSPAAPVNWNVRKNIQGADRYLIDRYIFKKPKKLVVR